MRPQLQPGQSRVRWARAVIRTLWILLVAQSCPAQTASTLGTLRGAVTDSSGAVVGAAIISLQAAGSTAQRTTLTDETAPSTSLMARRALTNSPSRRTHAGLETTLPNANCRRHRFWVGHPSHHIPYSQAWHWVLGQVFDFRFPLMIVLVNKKSSRFCWLPVNVKNYFEFSNGYSYATRAPFRPREVRSPLVTSSAPV